MGGLEQQLVSELEAGGAALVGFADLAEVPREARAGYPMGVSVAVAYHPATIQGIADGPTQAYLQQYNELNEQLDCLVTRGAELLRAAGFDARAQTREAVGRYGADLRTPLPMKTVATRAGLGWIGKCALLVTPQFGSAVRLSAILTDAPLAPAQPINESRCQACTDCLEACAAQACSGQEWRLGIEREDFWDAQACHDYALALTRERLQIEHELCGKCIVACPFTRSWISTARIG